jgi:SHS2 domain-containing protein
LSSEVDIVSKEDAEPSFASDAEGSGEIAAVLGETLDRVAQAIDDMHSEFDRTSSVEEIEKEIVVEDVKEVDDESWREELYYHISEPGGWG